MARPSKFERKRRMQRFAELCALDDRRLVEHVRAVGMSPWHALELLSSDGFCELVDQLQQEAREAA